MRFIHTTSQAVYRRKSGYGSYGPSGRKKGARVIVFRQGQSAADAETYLRLEDGTAMQSAFTQKPASRVPWQRAQWACEAGASSRLCALADSCIDRLRKAHVVCEHSA